MSQPPPGNIGSRTLRGMLWAFASYGGGRVLVFVATAVLARILTPEDFGLVAAALTIIALFDSVAHFGLGQALIIQPDEVVNERAETAFAGTLAIGLLAALVIAALSPLIAGFFDEPELVGISIALGANFFLRSLGLTHYSLAQRSLDFRSRTAAELTEAVVRGVAGIALALLGFGAWSLVLGYLAGTMALNVVIWHMVAWRPRFQPRRSDLPHLVRFGGTLTAVDVMATIIANLDSLAVGRVLGSSALGVYQLAYIVPRTAITNLAAVAGKVLFPAFAAIEEGRLQHAFLTSIRYVWMLSLPAAVLIGLMAEPVILVAFGDQWEEAIEPLRVFAVLGFMASVGFPAGTVYKATNRAGILLILGVVRFAALAVALVLFVDLGLTAAALCTTGTSILMEGIALVLASRLLATPLRTIGKAILPSSVAAGAMAAPVLLVSTAFAQPVIALLAGTMVGLVIFAGILHLLEPDAIRFLRRRLSPAPAAPPERP